MSMSMYRPLVVLTVLLPSMADAGCLSYYEAHHKWSDRHLVSHHHCWRVTPKRLVAAKRLVSVEDPLPDPELITMGDDRSTEQSLTEQSLISHGMSRITDNWIAGINTSIPSTTSSHPEVKSHRGSETVLIGGIIAVILLIIVIYYFRNYDWKDMS